MHVKMELSLQVVAIAALFAVVNSAWKLVGVDKDLENKTCIIMVASKPILKLNMPETRRCRIGWNSTLEATNTQVTHAPRRWPAEYLAGHDSSFPLHRL